MAGQWFQAVEWRGEIDPVEVESYTTKRVKINGNQRDRETGSRYIAPSFAEAKAWLESRLSRKVESYERSLSHYRSELAKVQALTEPRPSETTEGK